MPEAGKSLRALLKDAVDVRQNALLVGVVKSAEPLEIQVASDSQLLLTESNLYVPRSLQKHTLKVALADADGQNPVDHLLTIEGGLQAGDEVYLLSFDKGQTYFVIDLTKGE